MAKKSFYKQSAKVDNNSTTTVLEIEKPIHFTKSEEINEPHLTKKSKWFWWFFLTGTIFMITVVCFVAAAGFWYWRTFERTTNTQLLPLVKSVWENRTTDVFAEKPYKTILMLGLDQSENQRDNSILTDTMMFIVIRRDGSIHILSIPRDLWIDSLKTKINALYYYGQQENPGDGVTLVSSVIAEMTGMPVDYYIMMNMDTVKALVDAVDGVDVDIERAFEDHLYPREIDLSSKDPNILYETIRFEKGLTHMDGATALKFIRSRHSTDTFEGTDEGREARQQLLLTTLKSELMQPTLVTDPELMGSLYNVWKKSIKTNMSDLDVLLLGKQMGGKNITISNFAIPVQDSSTSGLIYHPQTGPIKQWVYLPVDATWKQMQQWVKEQL